jgi:HEAT repeat protein
VDERTQSLLESRHPGDRIQGLRLVVLLEDQDAAAHAERLLADAEAEVREHAARALGITRGGAAVERLARAAGGDEDAIVRRTALAILGEIGERASGERLAELLTKGGPQDVGTAVDSLRACGEAGFAAKLVPLANDPDARIRALALHATMSLEPRAGAPFADVARAVLADGPLWTIPAAALALGEDATAAFAKAAARATARDLDRAQLRALELPEAAGAPVLRALAALDSPDARVPAVAAARDLAKRGDPAGAPALGRALYGADASLHLDAACALAELGVSMGEPFLERRLDHATAAERPRVARALALLGISRGVPALGALLSGEVPYDRRAAALAFAELGRRDGVLELVRALDFPYRRERIEALRALKGLWREGPDVPAGAPAAERAPLVAAWAAHFARAT